MDAEAIEFRENPPLPGDHSAGNGPGLPQEPVAPPPVSLPAGRPWGFWITTGFSAVITMVNLLVTAVVVLGLIVFLAAQDTPHPDQKVREWIESSGLLMSVLLLLSAGPTVLLCVLFARLKKDLPLADYLALRPFTLPESIQWSIGIALFVLAETACNYLFDIPTSDWMVKMHNNVFAVPLLWQAIMVVAPVVEELFFRGFLFRGLVHTRWLGPVWAVVITAALWALLHTQYEPSVMIWIFLCGLYLGYARLRTQSLYIVILMHGVMNALATVFFLIELLLLQ